MVSRNKFRYRLRFLGGVLVVLAGVALLLVFRSYSGQHPAPAAAELFENGSPDHLVGQFTTIVRAGSMLSMMADCFCGR